MKKKNSEEKNENVWNREIFFVGAEKRRRERGKYSEKGNIFLIRERRKI